MDSRAGGAGECGGDVLAGGTGDDYPGACAAEDSWKKMIRFQSAFTCESALLTKARSEVCVRP